MGNDVFVLGFPFIKVAWFINRIFPIQNAQYQISTFDLFAS